MLTFLVAGFIVLALAASLISSRYPNGRPSLGFLFPVLEGAQGVTNKALTTPILAGQMDAILLDLRNVDAAATDAQMTAFLDNLMVKMTYSGPDGDSPVNIDDVPAGFFVDYAKRQGGYYGPSDGVIIPTTRYNLTGEEEINLRLSWIGADVAPLGAGCEVQAHRAYRMVEQADGHHLVYRARPLQDGNGLKYTVTAENVSEVYLWNADVASVTVHIEGRAYSLDADLMKTLTHYESSASEETRLVQIYAAGLLEQFSTDTIQFVINANAAQGYLVEVGSNPSPLALVRSRAAVVAKQSVKRAKIARENPKAHMLIEAAGVPSGNEFIKQPVSFVKAGGSTKPVKFQKPAVM